MRSAVPKHFHELLGRRMVDWVIEAGHDRPAPTPSSSSRRPRRATSSQRARSTSPCRRTPLGTGDAVRSRARRARGPCGRRARSLGRHAAAHRRAARRARRDPPTRGCRSNDPQRGAGRPARSTVASSAAPTARCCASSRAPTRTRRSSRSARSTRRSTSSAPRRSGRRSSGSSLKNVQGELYLTDAIEIVVADGGKVAAHIAADSREADGVNTRVRARVALRPSCATGSTRSTCSRG